MNMEYVSLCRSFGLMRCVTEVSMTCHLSVGRSCFGEWLGIVIMSTLTVSHIHDLTSFLIILVGGDVERA
jgi:hypothetical protein